MTIDMAEARTLEEAFLSGLNNAQDAYEKIVASNAWTALGFDTFAGWWDERVRPIMRALSMRPTREIAAAVIEQVRAEEAELPATWRRTQQELADMVGLDRRTASGWTPPQDHPDVQHVPGGDLDGSGVPAPLPARQEVADEILEQIDRQVSVSFPPWSADELDARKRLEAGETVVVSFRPHHTNIVRWAQEHDLLERIDRRSEWGNPFELPADGDRDTVIHNYAEHYLPHKPSLLARLGEIRGRALACWCAPEPCHGDVLKARAEA